jgi:penicillin-binding protein 2
VANPPGGNRVEFRRILLLGAIVALIYGIFTVRLFVLQILQGSDYVAAADENRITRVVLPASRGVIYDRNGVLLARNVPSFEITITPAELPDSEAEVQAIYTRLSKLTGVPITVPGSKPSAECAAGRGIMDLVDEWTGLAPYAAVKIQCNANPQTAMLIQEQAFTMPGVGVQVSPARDYPTGALTAHIIGYMGPIPAEQRDFYESRGLRVGQDRIGYAGVERSLQEILAGAYGQKLVEEDAAGLELRLVAPPQEPVAGTNLRLTIDTRLQAAAQAALQSAIDNVRALKLEFLRSPIVSGVVIAMNPQTGEILAMVSLPTYDNEQFAGFIPLDYYNSLLADQSNPLINHAVQGEYPPGSVFKMATAIGALNEHVITPEKQIFDPGQIVIQNRYFPNDPGRAQTFVCYDRNGHGMVNFLKGVAVSCDVYFYKLGGGYPGDVAGGTPGQLEGAGLGIVRIKRYAEALGYGRALGIELPAEAAGLIPDPDWKRINLGENWATGDTYIATIGQGFVLATPLQVLESIATLANGGRLMKPTLLKEFLDGEGNVVREIEPQVLWDITQDVTTDPDHLKVDAQWVRLAQEGMREVVDFGTAANYAKLENVVTAGKTGTAEYCDNIAQSRNLCQPGAWPTHSWYVGYGPFDNPEIAVVAFVYDGGEGAVTSGPIVKQVLQAYFELKAIDAAAQR